MKITNLKPLEKNPFKVKNDAQIEKIGKSIKDFERMMSIRPIIIDEENVILGGNKRFFALKKLGYKEIPDTWVKMETGLSEDEKREFTIKDNAHWGSEWDYDMLSDWNVDLADWGVDLPDFEEEAEELESEEQNKKLSDRFIIPPFSVLDTKQGVWQQRKNYWLSLGIKSEIGRENDLIYKTNGNKNVNKIIAETTDKTSVFDPVLCELAYKWFNVANGKILDPFAGGSVRGIVASKLGYEYLGNDLRSEQIDANRINAKEVLKDAEIYPTWTCGDSLHIDTIAKGYEADLVFSCPPYADLEVYSDKKEDLSNMSYKDFIAVYREIICKSCSLLKENRFAVFVVGDVRDKKGFYQNFVSDTIQAFVDCGMFLYNEMILAVSISSAPLRAARIFISGRKVIKVHQNVLVFYKGNPKNIKSNYPELDLSYMQDEELTEESTEE